MTLGRKLDELTQAKVPVRFGTGYIYTLDLAGWSETFVGFCDERPLEAIDEELAETGRTVFGGVLIHSPVLKRDIVIGRRSVRVGPDDTYVLGYDDKFEGLPGGEGDGGDDGAPAPPNNQEPERPTRRTPPGLGPLKRSG